MNLSDRTVLDWFFFGCWVVILACFALALAKLR